MIKTLQSIYKKIKKIYNDNPSDLLSIITSTSIVLFLVVIMTLIENDIFSNKNVLSIQYVIFNIATQLFYTGMMIGLIKNIFKTLDHQEKKISNIFNYFDILPNVVLGSFLNYFILLLSLIPSILFVHILNLRSFLHLMSL